MQQQTADSSFNRSCRRANSAWSLQELLCDAQEHGFLRESYRLQCTAKLKIWLQWRLYFFCFWILVTVHFSSLGDACSAFSCGSAANFCGLKNFTWPSISMRLSRKLSFQFWTNNVLKLLCSTKTGSNKFFSVLLFHTHSTDSDDYDGRRCAQTACVRQAEWQTMKVPCSCL